MGKEVLPPIRTDEARTNSNSGRAGLLMVRFKNPPNALADAWTEAPPPLNVTVGVLEKTDPALPDMSADSTTKVAVVPTGWELPPPEIVMVGWLVYPDPWLVIRKSMIFPNVRLPDR